MSNSKLCENSHGASKTITLIILTLLFLAIAFLAIDKNVFVTNINTTINTYIGSHQYSPITNAMLSITKIGNWFEALVIFVIFGLFLIFKNKRSFFVFVTASALGSLLPFAIKLLTQIQRPINIYMENDYSFPSGHATIAIVFLLSSIFLLMPLIQNKFSKYLFSIIVYMIFPLVAFSRIYLSVHWTSDVLGGILLGAICFVLSEIICCHKKENVL